MIPHRFSILPRCVASALLAAALGIPACTTATVRLITLDPGHFHASLVQKSMYPNVDPVVHVYAPEGPDLREHLQRIQAFNARAEQPTHWIEQVSTGPDFFQKMLADHPGNLVIIAGNNTRKTDYILRSVQAGLNVLADKPMVIAPTDFDTLKQAFAAAVAKRVLLYDIMTERYEITSILQRELSQQPVLFGHLIAGTSDQPAIIEQSVHFFSKIVSGSPLKRPAWFFDIRQEGESITDVATHLVDLIQCEAFPEQPLAPADAHVLAARHWSTPITLDQFRLVTGEDAFPPFLQPDIHNNILNVYANGEFTYQLRGIYAKVTATWEYQPPTGSSDTHYSLMRGTQANLEIRQAAAQSYKPTLYITQPADAPIIDDSTFEARIRVALATLQPQYPGIGMERQANAWMITIPARYDVGHEAHFAQVTNNFLQYLHAGHLPAWEVPNMLTKYATLMQAYQLSR